MVVCGDADFESLRYQKLFDKNICKTSFRFNKVP